MHHLLSVTDDEWWPLELHSNKYCTGCDSFMVGKQFMLVTIKELMGELSARRTPQLLLKGDPCPVMGRIETNVPKSAIPHDFVTKAVPVLAKALGKPEQYCVVSVIPDIPMSFGGTTDPCAIANLMSIGALGVEQNKKHSKVLFDLVEKELGVAQDRMYITFQDNPTGNVGFKGTTFHSIFG